LGTPQRVAEAARSARKNGVTGFMPSMEAFSYVTQHIEGGEPGQVGIRRKAFGLDTLNEGRMPYRALLARVQRFAFREFSQDPDLEFPEFERRLGRKIFGSDASPEATMDLLDLQRIFTFDSDWYWASPLTDPEFFRARAKRLNWPKAKLAEYRKNLKRSKEIAVRYAETDNAAQAEMGAIASGI